MKNLLAKRPASSDNHLGLWPPLQKTEGNLPLSILEPFSFDWDLTTGRIFEMCDSLNSPLRGVASGRGGFRVKRSPPNTFLIPYFQTLNTIGVTCA